MPNCPTIQSGFRADYHDGQRRLVPGRDPILARFHHERVDSVPKARAGAVELPSLPAGPGSTSHFSGELFKRMAGAMSDIKERLSSIGAEPAGMGPAEFGATIKRDIARWKKVAQEAGIRL